MDFWENCAYLSGVLSAAAFLLYIHAMVRAGSRPSPSGWLIWTIVDLELLATNFILWREEGLPRTSVMLFVYFILTAYIFLFSFIRERKIAPTKRDRFYLAAALLASIPWLVFRSPAITLFLNLAIHSCGTLTIVGKLRSGEAEERIPWLMFLLGAFLQCCSIGPASAWTVTSAAAPVYFFLANLAIVIANEQGIARAAESKNA